MRISFKGRGYLALAPVLLLVAATVAALAISSNHFALAGSPARSGVRNELLHQNGRSDANSADSTRQNVQGDDCRTWNIVTSPSPGSMDGLRGVAALSANDVWAVGSTNSGNYGALIEHWDGTQWSVVSAPDGTSALNAIAAISPNDIWAVGSQAIHWNGTSWSMVSIPITGATFYGIDALAANDVWAVGYYGTIAKSISMHWNGSQWSTVTTPQAGTGHNHLYGVAAVAPNDVWAVGDGSDQTLTMRWNGTQWSIVPSPNLGSGYNRLNGVTAAGANDVWAVGTYQYSTNALILHWNGSSWSSVPNPNLDEVILQSVTAIAPNDVWAVGFYFGGPRSVVEHWDGEAWSIVFSPSPTNEDRLFAVSAAGDLWAVGDYYAGAYRTFTMRYRQLQCPTLTPTAIATATTTNTPKGNPSNTHTNTPTPTPDCGQAWSIVDSPNVGSNSSFLNGLDVLTPSDAWAVGIYYDSSGRQRTLAEHWNGTTWSVIPSPDGGQGGGYFNAVAAISANDVWAVGAYQIASGLSDQTLVEHWNGSTWSVVPSPNGGQGGNILTSVSPVSANDVWAVGYTVEPFGQRGTLVLHWNGTAWSLVPSPSIQADIKYFSSVSAIAADDIWAVGGYQAPSMPSRTLAAHWDGTQWSIVPSANVGSNDNGLAGVTAISANDVWAVGSYANSSGTDQTLAIHWNGTTWSVVPTPNSQLGLPFTAVTATSSKDVWAVGGSQWFDNATLIEHWDGTQWNIIPNPNPPETTHLGLSAVAAISTFDVWAVGAYFASSNPTRTLVERYLCSGPSPTPTNTSSPSTATPTRTPTSAQPTRTATAGSTTSATSTPTPCSMSFTDVVPTDYFYEPVQYMYCHGIISGYEDNTFRPYNNTTRSQMVKIVVLGFGIPLSTRTTPTFADVPTSNAFFVFVETASENGIVSGYQCGGEGEPCDEQNRPYFRPYNLVTRGQLSKIVVVAAAWELINPPNPTFSDVPPSNAFYAFVETAYCHQVISGYADGTFKPGNNATRGQISKIVYLAILNEEACQQSQN